MFGVRPSDRFKSTVNDRFAVDGCVPNVKQALPSMEVFLSVSAITVEHVECV